MIMMTMNPDGIPGLGIPQSRIPGLKIQGPTKSRPEPSGTARSRPDTVLTPPGAVRMPPGSIDI